MKLENVNTAVALIKKRDNYLEVKKILEDYTSTAIIKVMSTYTANARTADIRDSMFNAQLVTILEKSIEDIENAIKEL